MATIVRSPLISLRELEELQELLGRAEQMGWEETLFPCKGVGLALEELRLLRRAHAEALDLAQAGDFRDVLEALRRDRSRASSRGICGA